MGEKCWLMVMQFMYLFLKLELDTKFIMMMLGWPSGLPGPDPVLTIHMSWLFAENAHGFSICSKLIFVSLSLGSTLIWVSTFLLLLGQFHFGQFSVYDLNVPGPLRLLGVVCAYTLVLILLHLVNVHWDFCASQMLIMFVSSFQSCHSCEKHPPGWQASPGLSHKLVGCSRITQPFTIDCLTSSQFWSMLRFPGKTSLAAWQKHLLFARIFSASICFTCASKPL